MDNFTIQKSITKTTMSISIDSALKKNIIKAAKKEGVSISSFVVQALKFVLSEKK